MNDLKTAKHSAQHRAGIVAFPAGNRHVSPGPAGHQQEHGTVPKPSDSATLAMRASSALLVMAAAIRRLFRRLTGRPPGVGTASASAAPASPSLPRDPAWAEPLEPSMNLHRVTPTLFRSARLDRDDLPQLRSLGIRTVLSLRNFHSDQKLLQGSGIRAVSLGANTWAVGDRHVVATMRAIRAAERDGPVLLHCLHGADRTGMMVAMYRMLYQDWPRERALAELRDGGYGYHTVWLNIERYLERVDLARIRSAIDAPMAPPYPARGSISGADLRR